MNRIEFRQLITHSQIPLVVDFWAPWCAPCRLTKPFLEELAQEYAGKVEFLAVNADQSSEVIDEYHVLGIPTVLAFQNGKVVGRLSGAQDRASYRAIFTSLAQGGKVEVSINMFDRLLRIGAGILFILAGIFTSSWILLIIGSVVAFLGIYDRCPVWNSLITIFRRRA